jgi:hypothetical protein
LKFVKFQIPMSDKILEFDFGGGGKKTAARPKLSSYGTPTRARPPSSRPTSALSSAAPAPRAARFVRIFFILYSP